MPSSVESDDVKEVIAYANGLKDHKTSARCSCMKPREDPRYENFDSMWKSTDFLLKHEISKDARGFVAKFWYVCTNCGKELK